MTFYNDNDPKACAWLVALAKDGLIPPGEVDGRSITDIKPADLAGYSQCHFFAGIGGWAYALRLAGWPEDREVWTASCPCQPFSVAGKAETVGDERHLWPTVHRLIAERRPPVIFGEQVASEAGREWLAGIRLDLEGMGYAVGAADLCAAGVGAPHIRQRLYWVAESASDELARGGRARGRRGQSANDGRNGRLANTPNSGAGRREPPISRGDESQNGISGANGESASERLANSTGGGQRTDRSAPRQSGHAEQREQAGRLADTERQRGCGGDREGEHAGNAFSSSLAHWERSKWLQCRDGVRRRIPLEPALFPLADGIPGRVGLLRGAGNAIVPPLAAEFIKAYLEARAEK